MKHMKIELIRLIQTDQELIQKIQASLEKSDKKNPTP